MDPDATSRPGRRPFLTARWSNLLLVSYHVDPALLEPLVPAGCELDLFEGRPAVSLVAFDFLDTRVRGIRWPGYVSFPEINLRYYLRQPASAIRGAEERKDRRGVSFVRELVPKWLIAAAARTLYNEPYVACPMRSSVSQQQISADGVTRPGLVMHHEFTLGDATQTIDAKADAQTLVPSEDSADHWFKEHQWGFGRDRRGRSLVYEVRHPVWSVHRVLKVDLNVDFGRVYGERWAFLKEASPVSIAWAVGSEIAVFPHGRA